jgi:hypothetical protein
MKINCERCALAFRKSDNLPFQFPLGFALGDPSPKSLVDQVLNAPAPSICQSKVLHCFFRTNTADDARFNANGNCASRANDPMPLSE